MLKTFRLPGFQDLKHTALQLQSSYGFESKSHDEDAKEDVIESMLYLPEHDPCFGHSIHLVVYDGFKMAGAINKMLTEAANIVSYICRSIKDSEILEEEKRFQPKCYKME